MKICIWRYLDNTRNYPGYHLSADADGCRTLRERLSDIHDSVSIALTPPDVRALSVPNNQGGKAKYLAGQRLRIETSASLAPGTFQWQEQDTTFILTCSVEQIPLILKGVSDIEKGEGDYALGAKHQQHLWFWW